MDTTQGTFEPNQKGHGGHLRTKEANYRVRPKDIVVPTKLCQSLNLRGGEFIIGMAGRSRNGPNAGTTLQEVQTINDHSCDDHLEITPFQDLTPIDPEKHIVFAMGRDDKGEKYSAHLGEVLEVVASYCY